MFRLSESRVQVLWRSACLHIFTLDPPPRPSLREAGLSTWPRGSTQYLAFPCTSKHEYLRWTQTKKLHSLFELWERSKVKPSFKHSVALFFRSDLVSGAAAAPNPHRKAFIWDWFQSAWARVGERGELFCKSLVPFWGAGFLSILLIKGSFGSITPNDWALLPGTTLVGKHTEIDCGQSIEGVSMCITPGELHHKTSPSANSAVCQQCWPQRASSLCNPWLGWENSGVGSLGTGLCPLQSAGLIPVCTGSKLSVWISLMPQIKGAPWWGVIEDACV